jgi:single-strand DNA-binding protein
MIRASINGRLGADPVERTTRNSKVMVTSSIAVNAARSDGEEETIWINLAAFGKPAQALARHTKGDLLAAMGILYRNHYTNRDGLKCENWQLTVEAVVSARTVRPRSGRKRATREPSHAKGTAQAEAAPFDDALPF